MTTHVYPVNDLRDHVTEGAANKCWCHPEFDEVEGELIVIHNALDQREKYETGELKPQ
jgi:hypothetical protein